VTRVAINGDKAIEAYLRRLRYGPDAFDRYVQGDQDAIGPAAKRGAALFVGKANCARCHAGPYLSDERFHNVGLRAAAVATVFINANDRGASVGLPQAEGDPLNVRGVYSDGDDGRIPLRHEGGLEGAFRTPRLRCSSERPSFMHTGQLRTLEQVVSFFNRGGDSAGYPGRSEIGPLSLSGKEREAVVAFLKSLNGAGPAPELLQPPGEVQ
jgi:cytochrome c peroxidase